MNQYNEYRQSCEYVFPEKRSSAICGQLYKEYDICILYDITYEMQIREN
jgi:hypothetical protein